MSVNKTKVSKDFKARSIVLTREFDAPLVLVWRAYSESDFLDQWWAPAPFRVETKSFNFAAGGHWLYAMINPEGRRHWGRMNYVSILPHRGIRIEDAFCDEHGNVNPNLPTSRGEIVFAPIASGTRVELTNIYQREEDLQTIVAMGFEQGVATCLDQLEALLQRTEVR
jgi:uncharacterized protein YndB with AHSA1/START domain